jgi:hypothetical protein
MSRYLRVCVSVSERGCRCVVESMRVAVSVGIAVRTRLPVSMGAE